MTNLRLFLLGAPYLEVDGQTVEIQRRKVLALFSYLAVTGQVHQRDSLATLLWPNVGQSEARAALGRHLSELRKIIGDKHLQADRELIATVDDLWVDAKQFQRLVADFDHDSPKAIALLTEAVALYRADFLIGFSLPDCPDFDEWQFFQSEGLRQEFAAALRHLVTALCEQEDYSTALAHARRLLSLDPLNETAHRLVMDLYARIGQQSAALRQYQICVQTLENELGTSPSEETTDLYERIRAGNVTVAADRQASKEESGTPRAPSLPLSTPHNLPAQTTTFIGREAELVELVRFLTSTEERLVTIVGPGGMGKTRLALALAEHQLSSGHFPQGIFFVSLAHLSEVASISPAIAEAIGCTLEADGPLYRPLKTQLLNYLRQRQMLLVLDNFEHLSAGSELLIEILQAAPRVRILVTSRERLHLQVEQLFPIRGLTYPEGNSVAESTSFPAVELFMQSALRMRPNLVFSAENRLCMSQICRLIEGMPLAIELAAGWSDTLSLAEIEAELHRSLDILETEVRDIPHRQRSIRAVFNSTWARLSEPEQGIITRLSVFRGGFTRRAATEVAGASLRQISGLVSKSLLLYDQAMGRYQIHELLRQFAGEKLESRGQIEEVHDVHALYFASFLKQQEAKLKGPDYRESKAAIAADYENVRQAWLWAIERRDYAALAQAIEALHWFLYSDLQHYQDGQELFQCGRERLAPAEHEAPHPLWGKMLARILPYGVGDFEQPAQASAWLEQALAIAEAQGDEEEQAFCHMTLGKIRRDLGEYTIANAHYEQSLRYYRQVDDRFSIAHVLHNLGETLNRLRQSERAIDVLHQSLQIRRELGISEFSTAVLLGLTLAYSHDVDEGEALLRHVYQISETEDNKSDMAAALLYLSRVLSRKGDFQAARAYAHKGLAIAQENNLEYRTQQAKMDIGMRAYERGDIEEALSVLGKIQDHPTVHRDQIRIETRLALAMAQLGKEDLAWQYLLRRLRGPTKLAQCNLILAIFLFTQAGEYARAVTLLSLFTVQGTQVAFWSGLNVDHKFQSLCTQLTTMISPDAYAAAWEKGQQADLDETIAALAEELSISRI